MVCLFCHRFRIRSLKSLYGRKKSTSVELIYYLCSRFHGTSVKSSKFPTYNLYTFQGPFKKNTSIPTWKVTENEANEENRKRTPGQIITASNRRCVHNLSMHCEATGHACVSAKAFLLPVCHQCFLSGSQMLLFSVAPSPVLWASTILPVRVS